MARSFKLLSSKSGLRYLGKLIFSQIVPGRLIVNRIWKMPMVHNTKVSKKARGRPQIRPDDETRDLIIEAARQEFHASGYAGASMGRVAERAGVSTKTMYRLIPTKAELFQSVVSGRISRFMLQMDEDHIDGLPLDEARAHSHR